jgi:hypothetical protein
MKKLFVRMVFATFICGVVFIGCKDEGKNEVVDPQSKVVNDEILIPNTAKLFDEKSARKSNVNQDITPEIEVMLEDVAKNIAENLDNVQLRKLLKEEALLKRDGDFDILVNSLINEKSDFQKMVNKKDKQFTDRLKNYIINYPKLNISIPMHIEKWDVNTKQLLVAALRNHEEDYLVAFGSNKLKMLIDHNKNPDKPVIVVGFNERIELVKTTTKLEKKLKILNVPTGLGLQHANASTFYLNWTDVSGESGYEIHRSTGGAFSPLTTTNSNVNLITDVNLTPGQKYYYIVRSIIGGVPTAWSQIIATTASGRNDNASLTVTKMRFNDETALRVVEKWASGAPEMRLRVLIAPNGATTTAAFTSSKIEPPTRNSITNQYYFYSVPVFTSWSASNTVTRFNWREEDWNDNGTLTLNANYEDKLGSSTSNAGTIKAGISYSITSDPGKDLIADLDVYFWDPTSKEYASSIFKWQF